MRASGISLDKIASKFGVQRDSLWRHWTKHVPESRKSTYLTGPKKLAELTEIVAEESGSTLDHLRVLRSILMQSTSNAAQAGEYGLLATLTTPLLKTLRQLGHVTGEISTISNSITINNHHTTILTSGPYLDLQTGLLSVTSRFPEARAAIVSLLNDLDRKYSPEPVPAIEARPIVCEPVESTE